MFYGIEYGFLIKKLVFNYLLIENQFFKNKEQGVHRTLGQNINLYSLYSIF